MINIGNVERLGYLPAPSFDDAARQRYARPSPEHSPRTDRASDYSESERRATAAVTMRAARAATEPDTPADAYTARRLSSPILLTTMIHQMGGAVSSSAKGTFVDLLI
jgi:hypothetical protein